MIKLVTRKTFAIRESGRSTDFISPSFGFGCLYDCTYCYMKRHRPDKSVDIAKNTGDILTAINDHATWLPKREPNQTDPTYYTYDISCNEDFALHAKHHNWKRIFQFFMDNDRIKGSFATKYVNPNLLEFDPKEKIRIRFSLMPQVIADKLEPNTSKIIDRIKAIDDFIEAGYEVHINFSPIVVYEDWLKDYADLFRLVSENVIYKDEVLCECIFLTHNASKHIANLESGKQGENLLWTPSIQENKTSQYGGNNIRYKHELKSKYITQFRELHDEIIPWNTIRYIF